MSSASRLALVATLLASLACRPDGRTPTAPSKGHAPAASGKLVPQLPGVFLARSPNGTLLALAYLGTLEIADAKTGEVRAVRSGNRPTRAWFNPTSTRLYFDEFGTTNVWDLETDELQPLSSGEPKVHDVSSGRSAIVTSEGTNVVDANGTIVARLGATGKVQVAGNYVAWVDAQDQAKLHARSLSEGTQSSVRTILGPGVVGDNRARGVEESWSLAANGTLVTMTLEGNGLRVERLGASSAGRTISLANKLVDVWIAPDGKTAVTNPFSVVDLESGLVSGPANPWLYPMLQLDSVRDFDAPSLSWVGSELTINDGALSCVYDFAKPTVTCASARGANANAPSRAATDEELGMLPEAARFPIKEAAIAFRDGCVVAIARSAQQVQLYRAPEVPTAPPSLLTAGASPRGATFYAFDKKHYAGDAANLLRVRVGTPARGDVRPLLAAPELRDDALPIRMLASCSKKPTENLKEFLGRTTVSSENSPTKVAVPQEISEQEAVAIAQRDAGGFLGTWVTATKSDGRWYISAVSKSAKPPVAYLLDARSGAVLLKDGSSSGATVRGVATDSPGGATIVMADHTVLAIHDLKAWPANLVGKRVHVTGMLQRRPNAQPGIGAPIFMLAFAKYRADSSP